MNNYVTFMILIGKLIAKNEISGINIFIDLQF